MVEVLLTGLNDNEEGVVQSWLAEEGDMVREGEPLVELTTGDSSVTIPAPSSGLLIEIYYDEGEAVQDGEVLCCIDDEEEADDVAELE